MTTPTNTKSQDLSNAEQIDQVLSMGSEVETSQGTVKITKIKVKHIRKVMDVVRPISHKVNVKDLKDANVLALVTEHTEDVLKLVAILADVDETKLEEYDLDDLVTVTTKVLEVNLDFFIKNVLPKFSQVLQNLTEAVAIPPVMSGQSASKP